MEDKKKMLIFMIIIVLIVILGIIFFPKIRSNPLIGTWTTDGITIYRFDKNNKGALIVPLSEYEFTYKIEDNKLFIDFKNEKSKDSDYEYSIENDKLILKGINKTTGSYTFTRK